MLPDIPLPFLPFLSSQISTRISKKNHTRIFSPSFKDKRIFLSSIHLCIYLSRLFKEVATGLEPVTKRPSWAYVPRQHSQGKREALKAVTSDP